MKPPAKMTLIYCREVGDLILWRCGNAATNEVQCPHGVPCPAYIYTLTEREVDVRL